MKKNVKIKFIVLLGIFSAWALVAVVLVFAQGMQLFFDSQKKEPKQQKVEECKKSRLLDGVCIGWLEKENYPIAIMIDNKYEARPWSGLSFAGLVFEAPVEGGITRFLAFYSTDREIEKIGPVRSVRPYYIDWAMGIGAMLFHVGGSPEALGVINNNNEIAKLDLDQYFGGKYYWRSDDRIAPHNVYTSSDRLNKARNANLDDEKPNFSPWLFKDGVYESERGDTKIIEIDFSWDDNYDAEWKYDKGKNLYVRMIEGEIAKDKEDALILASNIAVVETDIWIVDSLSRRKIVTEGKGDAIIFQDGQKILAFWEKEDRYSRLRFYDKEGNEIKFNRGTTWVEVVSSLNKVQEKEYIEK